jgi:hypothetical protein
MFSHFWLFLFMVAIFRTLSLACLQYLISFYWWCCRSLYSSWFDFYCTEGWLLWFVQTCFSTQSLSWSGWRWHCYFADRIIVKTESCIILLKCWQYLYLKTVQNSPSLYSGSWSWSAVAWAIDFCAYFGCYKLVMRNNLGLLIYPLCGTQYIHASKQRNYSTSSIDAEI